MAWEEDNNGEREHSGKIADLEHVQSGYVPGAKVSCRIPEGIFPAIIIAAGMFVLGNVRNSAKCCTPNRVKDSVLCSSS